jgi:hypothetical protein
MELSFASEHLRSLCESRKRARKLLGNEAAALLARLLADIEACASVAELVGLLQGQVAAAAGEQWCTTVTTDCSVVFACGHVTVPRTKAGAVDWARVSRVKILQIGAHDG